MHPVWYVIAASPGLSWIFGAETLSTALGGVLATIVPPVALKIVSSLNERDTRARLVRDCDDHHAAWKRGDDVVATYGHYPPEGVR